MFSNNLRLQGALPRRSIVFPTGFSKLDELLSGGAPAGQILEIAGAVSSGKSTLALGACLQVLSRGKTAAWIDAGNGFWPLVALEAKFPLERLLVLRVSGGLAALKSAQLLLGAPGAAELVVIDLPDRFTTPNSNLVKLQRLAERAGAALVFLTQGARGALSLGAAVALRLYVQRRVRAKSAPPRSDLEIEVARHKQGPTFGGAEESVRGPDRLRVYSSL